MKKNIETLALSNAMTLSYQQNPAQLGLLLQIHIGEKLTHDQQNSCTLKTAQNYLVEAYFKTRAHDLGITLETVPSVYLTTYEMNEGLDEVTFIGVLRQLNALFTFIDFNTLRDVKASVLEDLKQKQKRNNKELGAVFLDREFADAAERIAFMFEAIQKFTFQEIQDYISALYVPERIHLFLSGSKDFDSLSMRVQHFKI